MYRTHTCGELRIEDVNKEVKLSGWINKKRDHGGLLFIDLRDHYGITQCIIAPESKGFKQTEKLRHESIITVEGKIVKREKGTINANMATGEIEVQVQNVEVLYEACDMPLPVHTDIPYAEDIRLKHRYIDLRREKMHKNIMMRSKIIQSLRNRMVDQGFLELQTPILTASSPEGARDFLVPSRHFPGQFYALPQAPQQFKQLYMMAGFDRYFQIAPCFRDEDARADRSPGEFYQLDIEMSFVTQEDVFHAIEPVLYGVFKEFAGNKEVSDMPFERITYDDAMQKYGCDKPDLRNPLEIHNTTDIFKGCDFSIFANAIEKGAIVCTIPVKELVYQSRTFFDKLNQWAQEEGQKGLGYITFNDQTKGPIAKFLSQDRLEKLKALCGDNGGCFFVCEQAKKAYSFAGLARTKIAQELNLINKNAFKLCWIVDFPMFEIDSATNKIDFSHNPFSMPQGGLKALQEQNPLEIKAYQYDIVCNGVELCSGAIRNHIPEIMYKAFEIAGYKPEDLDDRFPAMINALKLGAPPHGGLAPGIDRIVMLLLEEENLREIIAFPLNQNAQDLMMGAPSEVDPKHLRELGLSIKKN